MLSHAHLPQVGQETTSTNASSSPHARKIFFAAYTSCTGSSVKETRIVSPIPCNSSAPIPTALFTIPASVVPASVTPTCRGYAVLSASRV